MAPAFLNMANGVTSYIYMHAQIHVSHRQASGLAGERASEQARGRERARAHGRTSVRPASPRAAHEGRQGRLALLNRVAEPAWRRLSAVIRGTTDAVTGHLCEPRTPLTTEADGKRAARFGTCAILRGLLCPQSRIFQTLRFVSGESSTSTPAERRCRPPILIFRGKTE